MTSDPFASPKRRLTRARNHIDNVESGIRAFLETQPYIRTIECDAQGWEEHKFKLTRPIPDEITDLAYEAIEALRSSLDQAIHPIAEVCGSKRPDLIHFPVADTAADFENVMKGRLRDFPPDMLALFRSFKPYESGNELIWALNRVRRQSTHRLIVPVVTASRGFLETLSISSPFPCEVPKLEWNSAKDEVVFVRTFPGSDLKYQIDFAFFVTFGEVDGVAGEPLIETLRDMLAEAGRIVAAIEAEARRIGIVA